MKKSLMIALLLIATSFTACKKADPTPDCDISGTPDGRGTGIAVGGCIPLPANPCCETVLCTADFAAVRLMVSYLPNALLPVDSFVVTDNAGNPLPPADNDAPVYGHNSDYSICTVINDAWVAGHRNSSVAVHAKGYAGGKLLFDEPYTIVTDCCHVNKASGKDAVMIAAPL